MPKFSLVKSEKSKKSKPQMKPEDIKPAAGPNQAAEVGPDVGLINIVCPKCKCDFFIPLMRLRYIKSYAGNRLQVEWPSKEGTNDWAVFACADCGEVIKASPTGTIDGLDKKVAGIK